MLAIRPAWIRRAARGGLLALAACALVGGGEARGDGCHALERPEWAAFEFLGPAIPPAAADPAPPAGARVVPLPCTAPPAEPVASAPVPPSPALTARAPGPDLTSPRRWSEPADDARPEATGSRLERPPRPPA